MAHALAAQLPADCVRLGVACTAVRLEDDALVVTAADGTEVRAKRAIALALPPGLAARLALSPPLPPRLLATCRGTPAFMGSSAKTVVVYARAFWRDAGLSGAAFSRRGPLSEVHDHSPDGHNAAPPFGALLGFSAGPGAPSREDVLAQLVRLFGPEAAAPTELHCCDWSAEEHTTPADERGARAGSGGWHDALFAEGAWAGRLLLCTTETATSAGGPHLEGALAAAERAAAAIAALKERC